MFFTMAVGVIIDDAAMTLFMCSSSSVIMQNLWEGCRSEKFPCAKYCTKGGVYAKHCSTAFTKQVFPRL
jgi:hypothetical protein